MLRYADAIVKRGVDKLIDAIAYSAEPQTKNTETPQQQKRMGNDTDCAPQTTGNTTNCGLTEQTITPMDEQCNISYNVLDCTARSATARPDGQRRSSLPWFWGVNWCSCKCRADAAARLHCTA